MLTVVASTSCVLPLLTVTPMGYEASSHRRTSGGWCWQHCCCPLHKAMESIVGIAGKIARGIDALDQVAVRRAAGRDRIVRVVYRPGFGI